MGLSRTGSEACLVYTVLGTLARAHPPRPAARAVDPRGGPAALL
jgi:hypothetical protein